jgi:hypothetical protein
MEAIGQGAGVAYSELYFREHIVPSEKAADAARLAFASVYQIPFLCTWNFKHLANAFALRRLRELNDKQGMALHGIRTCTYKPDVKKNCAGPPWVPETSPPLQRLYLSAKNTPFRTAENECESAPLPRTAPLQRFYRVLIADRRNR